VSAVVSGSQRPTFRTVGAEETTVISGGWRPSKKLGREENREGGLDALADVRLALNNGRSAKASRTSEISQERSFVGALVQNQAIGWLRKGCSSLGGGTAVRFP
jgi:hypothetical protein